MDNSTASHQSSRTSSFKKAYKTVANGGGTYPFRGIHYFATHSFLWPLLKARLVPCIILSLFILFNLFFWTYLPQVAILAIFHRNGGAWFNGTILVLGEAAAITALLFEAWFVDDAQVDIFDAVLVAEGRSDLLVGASPARAVLDDAPGLDPRTRLGRKMAGAVYAPFSCRQLAEFVLLLPLNLLPVIGVPLFLVLTGYRGGPLLNWRYFKLKGFNRKQRKEFIAEQRLNYTCFGTVYLVLQLIPVFSMMFLLTTAAGSALMAIKYENDASVEVPDQVTEETIQPYEDEPIV